MLMHHCSVKPQSVRHTDVSALENTRPKSLQNYRRGETESQSESSGPTSLIKQGCPRAHCTGLFPDGS